MCAVRRFFPFLFITLTTTPFACSFDDPTAHTDDVQPDPFTDPISPPDHAAGLGVKCVEFGQADIWAPDLGVLSLPADLGRILRCVHVDSVSRSAAGAYAGFPRGLTADNGFQRYIIQYVTQGPRGSAHRVTALLYLPTDGAAHYPIVAVNHGTSGVGPSCGPTHLPESTDYMAIPLAAKGYAVVATDYTGMGVDEGSVSPYLVGEGAAFSILDGIRALRAFHDTRFDRSQLDDTTFLFGHSQGGQTTLFAHAMWDASVGGRLAGFIAIAPGWGDVRGANVYLGEPRRATDQLTLFVLMGLFGHMVYHGVPAASTWLSSSAQSRVFSLLHDQCFSDLSSSVPAAWPTQGDLFAESFLSAARSCDFTVPCLGFTPWAPWLLEAQPGAFKSDVPVLLLQGTTDTVVPRYSTSCVEQRLRQHGTPVQTCAYARTDHSNIVYNSLAVALSWMAARRRGQTVTVCTGLRLPTCP